MRRKKIQNLKKGKRENFIFSSNVDIHHNKARGIRRVMFFLIPEHNNNIRVMGNKNN